MRTIGIVMALGAAALVSACGYKGPALAGHEGLQFQVMSYYDRRAWEEGARCLAPRMTAITRTTVLEDTPERLVLNLRYHYRDDMYGDFGDDDAPFGIVHPFTCQGWSERTFTMSKRSDGSLDVVEMSGPQRR